MQYHLLCLLRKKIIKKDASNDVNMLFSVLKCFSISVVTKNVENKEVGFSSTSQPDFLDFLSSILPLCDIHQNEVTNVAISQQEIKTFYFLMCQPRNCSDKWSSWWTAFPGITHLNGRQAMPKMTFHIDQNVHYVYHNNTHTILYTTTQSTWLDTLIS